jgi:polyhydroxyalkanoate synthase
VFSACYAALNPEKVENLILTVAPLDFHADRSEPAPGSGYMNLWARSLAGDDVDRLIDDVGNIPGSMVGLTFLMMNPVGNAAKYTTDLAEIAADRGRLVHFLRMERWIADRAAHPGEVARSG